MILPPVSVELLAQTARFTANMAAAAGQMDSFRAKAVRIGDSLYATGMKMLGAGATLTTLGGGMLGAFGLFVKAASDVEEGQNLFEVSFGKSAAAVQAWSETLSQAIGMTAPAIRNAAGIFNVMFNSMGIADEQAVQMSKDLTSLAYDMASFYNLDPEDAFTKLRAGISGEMEPLKRLGILVNDDTIKQYALAHGLIAAGKELTQQEKVMLRYQLIMEQTQKAQGDMIRTGDAFANSFRRLTEGFKGLREAIGEAILKPVTELIHRVNDWIVRAKEWIKANPELFATMVKVAAGIAVVITVAGGLLTVFGGLAIVIGTLMSSVAMAGFTAMGGFFAGLIPVIVGVGAAITLLMDPTKSFMDNMRDAWSYVKGIFERIKGIVLGAYNAIKETFGSKISVLWSYFVAGWAFVTDKFRKGTVFMHESLLSFAEGVVGFLVNFRENMSKIWDWWKDNWANLLADTVELIIRFAIAIPVNILIGIRKLEEIFLVFGKWLYDNAGNFFVDPFVAAVKWVATSLIPAFFNLGKKIFEAIKNGIVGAGDADGLIPSLSELIPDYEKIMNTGGTLKERLAALDLTGGFKTGLEGFSWRTNAFPELNLSFDRPAKTMQEAADKMKENMPEQPTPPGMEGGETPGKAVAAMEAGTTAAYSAVYDAQRQQQDANRQTANNTNGILQETRKQTSLLGQIKDLTTAQPEVMSIA